MPTPETAQELDTYEAWLIASATRQELATLLKQAEQEPERYLLSGVTGLPGYRRAMTERLEALGVYCWFRESPTRALLHSPHAQGSSFPIAC